MINKTAPMTLVAMMLVASMLVAVTMTPPAAQAQTNSEPGTTWPINNYGPRPSDNAILKWNEELLQAIRTHPAQTGPTITARALGVLHTATYDAWAAYDAVAKGTRLGGTLRRPAAERTLANKNKAISFAAYRVLTDLFPPAQHPNIGQVDFAGQMRELGYDPNDTSTDTTTPQGIGNVVAKAVLDFRHQDGANQLGDRPGGTPDPSRRYADYTGYTPVNQWNQINNPWRWQPLCHLTAAGVANGMPPTPSDGNCSAPNYTIQRAATPQWARVTPFALISPLQYRVLGPPKNPDGSYSTAEIQTALDDTANLTDVEKAKAEYWADGPQTEFPPGHEAVFAQALSRKRNHTLDTDVKLFFILGNAMLDASIASWAWKYHYDYVRPITAIRAHKRGQMVNSWLGPNKGFGMVPGERWMPYQQLNVVTPPFPEYVSGHSTFSGAAASVLATFNGGDTFGASVTIPKGSSRFESNTPATDVTLSWPTFSHASDEAGMSRRWGGIHFQSGDYHGRTLGRQVAQFVYSRAQNYIQGKTSG
jgi:PAP2 superfamily